MKKIWEKLKKQWDVQSDFQVAVILVVFAVSGFSTLYVHRFINLILSIVDKDQFWIKLFVFILIILPIYTLLSYLWGIVFGQRKFFTRFIKLKIKILSGNRIYKHHK